MRVLKFQLQAHQEQTLMLPVGATILHVHEQTDGICLWALCESEFCNDQRRFRILATGETVPTDSRYLGTCHLSAGRMVFHVFEVTP